MHKWLTPSSIHFLQMDRQLFVETDDSVVVELSHKLSADQLSAKVPKMQVSEKDGQMFALNNSSLQLMLEMEKQGKLGDGLIEVEIVPLSKVPTNIQMGMTANKRIDFINTLHLDNNCIHPIQDNHNFEPESSKPVPKKKGYYKLGLELVKTASIKPDTGVTGITAKRSAQSVTTSVTTSDASMVRSSHTSDEDSDHDLEDVDEEEGNHTSSESSSESDDTIQCNVCDRTFASTRLLAAHQLNKKHFGCSVCETVFPSLAALQQHKQTLDHWSDDNNEQTDSEDNDQQNATLQRPHSEELERLL